MSAMSALCHPQNQFRPVSMRLSAHCIRRGMSAACPQHRTCGDARATRKTHIRIDTGESGNLRAWFADIADIHSSGRNAGVFFGIFRAPSHDSQKPGKALTHLRAFDEPLPVNHPTLILPQGVSCPVRIEVLSVVLRVKSAEGIPEVVPCVGWVRGVVGAVLDLERYLLERPGCAEGGVITGMPAPHELAEMEQFVLYLGPAGPCGLHRNVGCSRRSARTPLGTWRYCGTVCPGTVAYPIDAHRARADTGDT